LTASANLEELKTANFNLQTKLNQKLHDISDMEASIRDHTGTIRELETQWATSRSELLVKEAKIADLMKEIGNLSTLKHLIEEKDRLLASFQQKANELEARAQKAEYAMSSISSTLEGKNQRVTELKESIAQLHEKQNKLENTNARILEENQNLIKSNSVLNQQVQNAQEQRDSDEKQKTILQKDISAREEIIMQLRSQLTSEQTLSRTKIDQLQQIIEKSKEEILEIQKKLKEQHSAKQDELKSLYENDLASYRSKTDSNLEMLKQHLSEKGSRLLQAEKSLSIAESALKEKEIECVKLHMEQTRLSEDFKVLKENFRNLQENSAASIRDLENHLKARESDILQFKKESEGLKSQISQSQTQKAEIEKKLEEISKKRSKAEGDLKEYKIFHNNEVMKLNEIRNELEIKLSSQKTALDTLKAERESLSSRIKQLEDNKQENDSLIDQLQRQLSSLKEQQDRILGESNLLKSTISELQHSLSVSNSKIKELEHGETAAETTRASLETELAILQQQHKITQQNLEVCEARLEKETKTRQILDKQLEIWKATENEMARLRLDYAKVNEELLLSKKEIESLGDRHKLYAEHQSLVQKYSDLSEKSQGLLEKLASAQKSLQIYGIENRSLKAQLEDSKIEKEELKRKVENSSKLQTEMADLQEKGSEASRKQAKLESQIGKLQRVVAKQAKLIVTAQMGMVEIGNLIDMKCPWTLEEISTLPEKIKESLNTNNVNIFKDFKEDFIFELAEAIRKELIEKDEIVASANKLIEKTKKLQELNDVAHSELIEASNEIGILESRIAAQEEETNYLVEQYKSRIESMEKRIQEEAEAKNSMHESIAELQQKLKVVETDRDSLERDYLTVYERLQSTKKAFVDRAKAVTEETDNIIQQLTETKLALQTQKGRIQELEKTIVDLKTDKTALESQVTNAQQLLDQAEKRFEQLSGRCHVLEVQRHELESSIKSKEQDLNEQMACNRTLNENLISLTNVFQDLQSKHKDMEKVEQLLTWKNAQLVKEIETIKSESNWRPHRAAKDSFNAAHGQYHIHKESSDATRMRVTPRIPLPDPRIIEQSEGSPRRQLPDPGLLTKKVFPDSLVVSRPDNL
jgi:chromosome segregation ATPase